MSRIIPPESGSGSPATVPGDPRVGHLLGSGLRKEDRPDAVILGFPRMKVFVAMVEEWAQQMVRLLFVPRSTG